MPSSGAEAFNTGIVGVDNDAMTVFKQVRWRPGYSIDQVDAFVAAIGSRTAEEIDQVEFTTTRFSTGYDMRQVDIYLDARIAEKNLQQTA